MKQTLSILITALGLISICTQAAAQKDTSTAAVYKTWDDLLLKIKKEKKSNVANSFAEADTKLNATRDKWIEGINKSLSTKPGTEPWKEWSSTNQHTTSDINLLPLMEEAPAPIYILPLAGQADLDAKFDPYIKKIESQQKKLAEFVAKNSKLQQVYQKEGEEGVKKRAMAESDKSVIMQQMGGTEKLMNMSDAERKAAALKMASDVKSNPAMLTGNNSPGMNAMMQKMMTDKEYAKRFNKMSDAEKEAEMKKFIGESSNNIDATKSSQQRQQEISEGNNIKYTQDITLLNMRVQKRLEAAAEHYGKNVAAINEWVDNVKNKIGKWYSAKYAAIPVVELGEYGHDKDPEQVQALKFTVAYLTYTMVDGPEMKLRSDNWNQYKTNCKFAIGELNDFIGTYKWESHTSQDIFGPDADQQAVSGIGLAFGMMSQLAEEAKAFSSIAKGYQKQFETITTGN
jgi:hypothetical protein